MSSCFTKSHEFDQHVVNGFRILCWLFVPCSTGIHRHSEVIKVNSPQTLMIHSFKQLLDVRIILC